MPCKPRTPSRRYPSPGAALVLLLVAAAPLIAAPPPGARLVEAEAFADRGGWVVDSQFMDVMGSPFLLAHGLGTPVADASTTVDLAAPGRYRVHVRTRDWVATWGAPGNPGRFQVLVNGTPLATTFGTEGAAWHWQDGGTIEAREPRLTLTLHDLTGFEGRCDALLLTPDTAPAPPLPDGGPELAAFRRDAHGWPATPEDGGSFDFVVTGGGLAGTCAALAAARLGLKTALVQDRPVLGGNNSSEVRVWLGGATNKPPFPRLGDVVDELEPARRAHYGPGNTADLYEDDRRLALVRAEPNLTLLLEHRVNGAETEASRLRAVLAERVDGRRVRIAGRWFADCTGDGDVGALAGADFESTATGHMGACNLWSVAETPAPVPFPRCPWALDLAGKPFPGRDKDHPDPTKLGGWYWESGFDLDTIADAEAIRDWNLRAMYGAWDALKNTDRVLPNHRLSWAAFVAGKRESRRLLGDVVLSKEDILAGRDWPDGCVPTGWNIDLHLPDPRYDKGFEGNAFISTAHFTAYKQPYWVPYRCLYSRSVPNLFMAGRDVSVTHEALGAVRVMRTGGVMGEVIGMAAAVCRQHGIDPRGVYEGHLTEFQDLLRRGVGRPGAHTALTPPAWLPAAGPNLARTARLTVAANDTAVAATLGAVHDGQADLDDNASRWLSGGVLPHLLEFTWDQPQTLGAARVVSGYREGSGRVSSPLQAFSLQVEDAGAWRDIPGTAVQGNDKVDWSATFAPVTASRVRLSVTAASMGIARLWEVELYGPPPPP